ncbi:stalk domain-containing protein [Fontibacillus sp. BL9]|uniref:stalk domain-containing protein n=1 Tax=Fontibacillus sp. BL9 TaxID=3389971 RepID=UPI00397A48DA
MMVFMILALGLGGTIHSPISATAAKDIKEASPNQVEINVNGQSVQTDVPPVLSGQSVLIPIRSLSSLGLTYTWDAASQSAIVHNKERDVLKITVNSRTAYKNGHVLEMTAPALSKEGRVLIPIRFVSESLGYQVRYEAARKIVYITSNEGGKEETPEINLDNYYSPEINVEKKESGNKMIWTVDNIVVRMEKVKTVGDEAAESKYVMDAIVLENKDKVYPIKLDKRPSEVSSISLSPGGDYLALSVFYNHVGHKVIIINVSTGEQVMLNEMVSSSREGAETIHAYNWSPKGNVLAFAYGNTSESKLGVYDFDKQVFVKVSEANSYISTAFVLWNKNGEVVDVISEQPSDQYKMYRYSLNDKSVKSVTVVKREELEQFSKFRP